VSRSIDPHLGPGAQPSYGSAFRRRPDGPRRKTDAVYRRYARPDVP
jgi:hypothetical protein